MFLVTCFIHFFLISNYTSYTDRVVDCKSFATAPVVVWFGIDISKLVKILPLVNDTSSVLIKQYNYNIIDYSITEGTLPANPEAISFFKMFLSRVMRGQGGGE